MTTRFFSFAAVLLLAAVVQAAPGYQQGFETNIFGWDVFGGSFDATRVASGTGGIPSASGSFHAESLPDGAASNLGGYTCCFPTGGYEVALDIYLDAAWADGSDKRFNVSHAINNPQCTHRVDFVIAIGTRPGVNGEFIASASQNCPGWPSNTGRNPVVITTGTGWYNLKYILRDVAGQLDVDVELRAPGGALLTTWDLPLAPIAITEVSGNRYLWFCASTATGSYGSMDRIAFDNVTHTAAHPCEGTVAVEDQTWSIMKSFYR